MHFPANDLRDFVILRSDRTPTYLLAAAVDDVEMHMTHVIRGEDLVPSTPRQIEIMKALGASPPAYAHLPLIVGPDRQPLSKRHGAVSVERFREDGFLPEALVNYLALLGWSFDDATTFFGLPELIERFDLHRRLPQPGRLRLPEARVDERPLPPRGRTTTGWPGSWPNGSPRRASPPIEVRCSPQFRT